MKILHSVHPDDFKTYQTQQIRDRFLADGMAQTDQIKCVYSHDDRMIPGVVKPSSKQIELPNYKNLRTEYFLERREIGIINVGIGSGKIIADGQTYMLNKFDCLYIGKGIKSVLFLADDSDNTPIFYFLSAPAHKVYPTTLITIDKAIKVKAGDPLTANDRTINKYIHLEGIRSCQLVMGLTTLHNGSVWNTMPPHVHDRRMEAYFYFDIPEGQAVFHLMGEATETRHILMHNYDVVLSPPWSIHSGVGTASYSFIWGMGGENQDYTDMDALSISELR